MWWYQWLSSSASRLHCLLWTQIEIIDNVRNIGNSIRILLLLSQFVWELRTSRVALGFVWQSRGSDLSARVGLWVSLFHLLIDNWVVWSVDLKLVCVVRWFRTTFDVLTFHLNFWRLLLRYLFFAVFSDPRVNQWLLFLVYFGLASCLFIWRRLSLLRVASMLDFRLICYLLTCNCILSILLSNCSGTLVGVLDSLWTWLWLFQLPRSSFRFSFFLSLFFIMLSHLLANAHG